jgi:hypothetical protein
MTIKRKILFAAATLAISGAAHAENPTITLGLQEDVYYGYASQKQLYRTVTVNPGVGSYTGVMPDNALVNDTKIILKADGRFDHWKDVKYGALIRLNADTSISSDGDNNNAGQTMAHIEGPMGRLEAGSYTSAAHALHVSATQIGRGTNGLDGHGAIDSSWYRWISYEASDTSFAPAAPVSAQHTIQQVFLLTPQLYGQNIALAGVKQVNAARLTYYTPTFYGFRAGISYAPQLNQYGTVYQSEQNTLKKVISDTNSPADDDIYYNVFSGGINYSHKWDKVNFKAAIVGESGTSKVDSTGAKFHRLRDWEAGIAAEYMKWTISAAYGDLGKTKVKVGNNNKKANYWNLGLSYEHGPMGVSLSYASSKSQFDYTNAGAIVRNAAVRKSSIIAMDADWRVAKGIRLYAGALRFHNKDAVVANTPSNRGYMMNIGSFFDL